MSTIANSRGREVEGSDYDLMSVEELLQVLPGVTRGLLAQWRYERRGPDYVKLGRKALYLRASVEQWLQENLHTSSRDPR